jgi:hypothetical protein
MLSTAPNYTIVDTESVEKLVLGCQQKPQILDSAMARCRPKESAPANTARYTWRGNDVEANDSAQSRPSINRTKVRPIMTCWGSNQKGWRWPVEDKSAGSLG